MIVELKRGIDNLISNRLNDTTVLQGIVEELYELFPLHEDDEEEVNDLVSARLGWLEQQLNETPYAKVPVPPHKSS